MNLADGSLSKKPSNSSSNSLGQLRRREINKDPAVEQDSETITKSSASLQVIDANAPKDLNSERTPEKDSSKATRLVHSVGPTGIATDTHGFESSVFSINLPELPANTRWPSQNPQQHDDQLRSAGKELASVCKNHCGQLKAREAIAAWICNLSLAGEEQSVNYLENSTRC